MVNKELSKSNKIFKGKKLTRISPNKTISGAIGAYVFSLFLLIFFHKELFNYDFLALSLITVLISTTSQLGDLFISLLKIVFTMNNLSSFLSSYKT